MFRALVFLLAGWPLLMPRGMCVCQFVRAGDVSPRSSGCSCADDKGDFCPDAGCEWDNANRVPYCNQGGPSDEPCPPGCPANKKADHSRLVEYHRPLLAVTELAPMPLPLFLDFSSDQRLNAHPLRPQPPDQPIYLALCALLI